MFQVFVTEDVHIMEHDPSFVTAGMNLEDITLGEISQTQKDKYGIVTAAAQVCAVA